MIDRYHVNSIDFDIEGAAVLDQHSRSTPCATRQWSGLETANPNLQVSFTLPGCRPASTPTGSTCSKRAKNDGVKINVVNIMAMDYGQSVDNNGQMGQDAIAAARSQPRATHHLGLAPDRRHADDRGQRHRLGGVHPQ